MLPDQLLPDHVLPDHVLPDQVLPDQVLPDHVLPDQLLPDQVLPDHVLPDQVLPDQVLPFQTPPDQLDAEASAAASAAVLIGLPKMSCSPWRTMPLLAMWSVPREASRSPVPVEGALDCSDAATDGTEALRSLFMSSSPQPICFQLNDASLSQLSIAFT